MDNRKKLSEDAKKAWTAVGFFICCMIIYSMPVLNGIYVRKEAKKHPNIVQKITKDGVLIKDVKDGKDRMLGIKCFDDSAGVQNYLKQGDTIYVFSEWYDDKTFFEYSAKVIGVQDSINARKEREKIQQILNNSKTNQR